MTGGGGGIGFEAAKAFAYMGAKVIIAEVNTEKGTYAEKYILEITDVENLWSAEIYWGRKFSLRTQY